MGALVKCFLLHCIVRSLTRPLVITGKATVKEGSTDLNIIPSEKPIYTDHYYGSRYMGLEADSDSVDWSDVTLACEVEL